MKKLLWTLGALLVTLVLLGLMYWRFSNFFDFRQKSGPSPLSSPEDQQDLADRIAAATPQDEKQLYARAEQFFEHGAFTFAEKDLNLLLEKNPKNRAAYELLNRLYVRTRNFSAAEATIRKALEVFPEDSEFLVARGAVYVQQAKFAEARTTFAALPENSPEKNFFTGIMAIAEGQYEQAEELLNQAKNSPDYGKRSEILLAAFHEFSLFPDGSPLHRDTLLARALNDTEMYELSLELTKKVLQQNTQYRDAWMVNGSSYLLLGRYEFARTAFEKAFEIDPASPVVAYYLGFTLKRLGDLDTALSLFSRARQNGFTPLATLLNEIADTYYLQENYELALNTLQEMLRGEIGSVNEFIRPVHIALDLLKKSDTGITLGNAAVAKYPNEAMAWNLRGWAFLENNDLQKADADLTKALQLNPELVAGYLNLGKLREREDDREEALELYKKVYELDPFGELGKTAVERYNALIS